MMASVLHMNLPVDSVWAGVALPTAATAGFAAAAAASAASTLRSADFAASSRLAANAAAAAAAAIRAPSCAWPRQNSAFWLPGSTVRTCSKQGRERRHGLSREGRWKDSAEAVGTHAERRRCLTALTSSSAPAQFPSFSRAVHMAV